MEVQAHEAAPLRNEMVTRPASCGPMLQSRTTASLTVHEHQQGAEHQLYERIAGILDQARSRVARTVNTAMVHAYWQVGREIVEVEQRGAGRAVYGEQVMKRLSARLTSRYGHGFSLPNLKRMTQFYRSYPAGSTLLHATREKGSTASSLLVQDRGTRFPPGLSWSHYLVLLGVRKEDSRAFYEIEAARENWSVRELERQVASLLFERLARNKSRGQVRMLARRGQRVVAPTDVLKDPFVLEFLDLKEQPAARERGLEQAIINQLEEFLMEMGKGFCFVARQKRITVDGDHFYVDLVFYNRLLRSFVLLDLKLGVLTHQDLGQMQMYVNFFDRFQRAEHEAPTIGIVLCSAKNDAMVKITLPEENAQIHAARYQRYLPTEEELRAELERERDEVERALRLRPDSPPPTA